MNIFKGSLLICLILTVLLIGISQGQERRTQWKRSEPATRPDLQLFHSPYAFDLPTATSLQKWDVEFEISHRFIPTTGSGHNDLYGLDGPVNMRLALGMALSNRMVVTVGRSNFSDNVDLGLKYRLLQVRHERIPVLLAVRAGGAWNSDPRYPEISSRSKGNSRNFQGFGQVIINTLIRKRMGIGLVPSYLYNSDIRWGKETGTTEIKDTFRLGTYVQFYVSPLWSILAEWSPYISGYKRLVGQENNPLSFGIELETGGHFFKILLTNSQYLNTSQFLAGTDIAVDRNDWRIGFMITRLLKFSRK